MICLCATLRHHFHSWAQRRGQKRDNERWKWFHRRISATDHFNRCSSHRFLRLYSPQKVHSLWCFISKKKKKSCHLLESRGRPSLLTLRGMAAPLSSLSADRVFPTELPRLMALLGVWGCGEAVSDCWGLLDVLCHLLLLLRKGNLYSKEPLSLLLPLYSDTGTR